ncbi:RDD family protein [Streptomyces fructofermentans]|uniref:RDD domain-containing protein n=1 Tax=Streptomyces fructofermentans TaxID=152141 RepID=A0A918U5T5_9ACTN|nr:RDD family protein [Streptomyces fructofermentans]GGX97654.1 hypothetical protein GCM10010515_75010 [Streptomyces fructofermentans]
MSAPTPAPGDDRPREGYYPDPSIPGYVRYWNGASWVPGTSRPAPSEGRPLPSPAGARPAAPVSTEETGPHFFDEDPPAAVPSPAEAQHGSRPEPASAWGADRSRQTGFGGDPDRRVSWGSPDPRPAPEPARSQQPVQPAQPSQAFPPAPEGRSDHTDGVATFPPAASDAAPGEGRQAAPGGPVVFRRPTGPVPPAGPAAPEAAVGGAGRAGAMGAGRAHVAGAAAGRADAPADGPGVPGAREPLAPEGASAFRAATPGGARQPAAQPAAGQPAAGGAQAPGASAAPPVTAQPAAASAPPQAGAGAPVTAGSGGGQPSWAQQVHRLAGPGSEPPVVPWKPVREDPFQSVLRAQSEARPAGMGRRLAARLVDTVVLAAVTGAAAVPLGARAVDHVNEKIDAAKVSGETVTVWLLDSTTGLLLGVVLAVLLVFGVLYEALPTAKWGRTLGKKLCGLQVRDIEGGEPPSFAAALGRWLVFSVPALLVVGVVGVVWGLFDRPWRQCWHDKAAHTFVAG